MITGSSMEACCAVAAEAAVADLSRRSGASREGGPAAHYTPPMRFTIVGSGAVGGYYGAKLARTGHDVTFIARGAHLDAIRRDGLSVNSSLGDFTVRARAESDPADAPAADVVILAV